MRLLGLVGLNPFLEAKLKAEVNLLSGGEKKLIPGLRFRLFPFALSYKLSVRLIFVFLFDWRLSALCSEPKPALLYSIVPSF